MIDAAERQRLAALIDNSHLRRVLDALAMTGEETRLVGGAVRDALIGARVGDIDLTTTLRPDAVVTAAEAAGLRAVPTGIEHGTVTLISDGVPFEVTTLREDVDTDGRHATVSFGRDFAADAHRRDFTMNALSLSADGELFDPVGGLADLRARRVRFIGDANARVAEDYLRILRFFRFHAQHRHGTLDQDGLGAAIRGKAGLDRLSRERIRAELMKILAAPGAVAAIEAMSEAGILERLTGGVPQLSQFARMVEAGASAIHRLAALALMDREDVPRLRERLRLTNAETQQLLDFAAARLGVLAGRTAAELTFRHGPEAVIAALTARGDKPDDTTANALHAIDRSPFKGEDVVAAGIPAGPLVGQAIRDAEAKWLEGGLPSNAASKAELLQSAIAEIRARETLRS